MILLENKIYSVTEIIFFCIKKIRNPIIKKLNPSWLEKKEYKSLNQIRNIKISYSSFQTFPTDTNAHVKICPSTGLSSSCSPTYQNLNEISSTRMDA